MRMRQKWISSFESLLEKVLSGPLLERREQDVIVVSVETNHLDHVTASASASLSLITDRTLEFSDSMMHRSYV